MSILQQQWGFVKKAMQHKIMTEKETELYEEIYIEHEEKIYCWRFDKAKNEIYFFEGKDKVLW